MKTIEFQKIFLCMKRFSQNWEIDKRLTIKIAYNPIWKSVRILFPEHTQKWSLHRDFFKEEIAARYIPELCEVLNKEKAFQLTLLYEPEQEEISVEKSGNIDDIFINWYP